MKVEPQTIEELAKEMGYSVRHTLEIASEMEKRGEWIKTTKIVYYPRVVKAYYRKPKRKK